MINNDNSIIESLNSINFNEPHPIKNLKLMKKIKKLINSLNILKIHGSAVNVLIDLFGISLNNIHLEQIILVKLIIIK
jgi:hypothetical protein